MSTAILPPTRAQLDRIATERPLVAEEIERVLGSRNALQASLPRELATACELCARFLLSELAERTGRA